MKKLFAILLISIAAGACVSDSNRQNDSQQELTSGDLLSDSGDLPVQKFALVIGNGDYIHTVSLDNSVNDANDITSILLAMGFTVYKVLNGSKEQMNSAVVQYKKWLSASGNSYGLFYYSGHAVQAGGENFLLPVNANIQSENLLHSQTVSVQEILDGLNDAGNALNIVVLDACRDNNFYMLPGLSVVNRQPADSIIVFADAADSGTSVQMGRNSLFTSHLLNNLRNTFVDVHEMFSLIQESVANASGNLQRPSVYSRFNGAAYLNTGFMPSPQYVPGN